MRLFATSCSCITCTCHWLDPYQHVSIKDILRNVCMLRNCAATVSSAAAATSTGAPACLVELH
jgi:hypothetical protein